MWQTVLENLIPTIFIIITPPLALFVGKLFHKLAVKWHMESALAYEDKVDDLVIKGIQAVEQKSLAAAKKGGEPTPNEKKLDDAMKFVNAQLAALKLPEKAANELSMLVESHLFTGAKDQPAPAPAPLPPADVTPTDVKPAS